MISTILDRPTFFGVGLQWYFSPLIAYLGPPRFQRFLLDLYPHEKVQQLKRVIDMLWSQSVALVEEQKAALEAGDDAMNQRVGGGKDIMSILRKYGYLLY